MAGNNTSFERGASKAIAAPFRKAFILLVLLFVVIIGRMMIDATWISRNGPDSLKELQTALQADIAHADEVPYFLPTVFDPPKTRAMNWALTIYHWVYVITSFDHFIAQPATENPIEAAAKRGITPQRDVFVAMMVGTQIVAVRVSLLLGALPLLALFYLVGGVDGLAFRSIRRIAAGRESSSIYHRVKYVQVVTITIAIIAYLWWPGESDPRKVFVVTGLICGLMFRYQTKFFKKYF